MSLSRVLPASLQARLSTPALAMMSASLLAVALALPAAAQEAAPVVTQPAAPLTAPTPSQVPPVETAPAAATDAAPVAAISCQDSFAAYDLNADGVLSEDEAPSVFARARVDNVTVPPEGLSMEDYLTACEDAAFDRATVEEGAPFEGANSFTEDQARDRIMANGYTDVSALTLDDAGIWRGTAQDGADGVAIAVDFKGNVVASAQ